MAESLAALSCTRRLGEGGIRFFLVLSLLYPSLFALPIAAAAQQAQAVLPPPEPEPYTGPLPIGSPPMQDVPKQTKASANEVLNPALACPPGTRPAIANPSGKPLRTDRPNGYTLTGSYVVTAEDILGKTWLSTQERKKLGEWNSSRDTVPVVRHRAAFAYPTEAADEEMEGQAWVLAVVDRDGRVSMARTGCSSHPVFNESAQNAVSQFLFDAATVNGNRVPMAVFQKVIYKITE
jgi:TonB family protein